ncbi:MAG: CotH kinase family protein [Defluviitaleaceae bacterium]|nr:CotH kinase family protein [Defluviitaleaceae bacterium]
MRKSIVYYAGSFVAIVVLLLIIMNLDTNSEAIRYHQHLRNPSEADLGICSDCNQDIFLCTHLPIIIVDTFSQDIPGRPLAFGMDEHDTEMRNTFHTTPEDETETTAHISVIDNSNGWNHDSDTPTFESLAAIRIRGNSSRFFDKPNYRIRLVNADDSNNRLPLLGMAPGHEWALHGPFLDKTLIRNYMWMNIAFDVMSGRFVPGVRFFELILNGEFQGLYVLMETLRVEPSRVSLSRYRPGMPETSYFFRIDWTQRTDREIETFSTYTLRQEFESTMEILYPTHLNQSERVRNYVMGSINTIERFLYSHDMLLNPRTVERYIDIDSFVDFFIINEFIGNNDLFAGSTYFHKDIRGRLVAGPVWDFNNIFDNFFLSLPVDEFYLNGRGWLDRLFMSSYFTEKVINRWNSLRQGALSEERLLNYMDDVIEWLGSAIDRNFDVWGYSFDYRNVSHLARRQPRPEERLEGITEADLNPSSFEEAMAQKRDFMIERGRWIDNHIVILRQYSHRSRHALWHLP